MCVVPLLAAARARRSALLLVAVALLGAANGALDVAMNTQGTTIEQRRGRLLLGRLHAAFSAGGLAGAASGALAVAAGADAGAHLAIARRGVRRRVARHRTRALLGGDEHPDRSEPTFARPTRALLALGVARVLLPARRGRGARLERGLRPTTTSARPRSLAALGVRGVQRRRCSSAACCPTALADARSARSRCCAPAALLAGGGLAARAARRRAGRRARRLRRARRRPVGRHPARLPRGAAARRRARRLAAVSTLGYTGFLAGPPVIGAIAEVTSLPRPRLVALCAGAAADPRRAVRPPQPTPARHPAGGNALRRRGCSAG